MRNAFRFVALASERFAPLFERSDMALRALGARRLVVDEYPGFPCRVSLADARVGETVLALPFTHHDVDSPYRASGPIFVRRGVESATPEVDEIPVMFAHRLLSLRGYDEDAMMITAEVVDGSELEAAIRLHLDNESVRYLHLHNARPGCYNCRVERA
ncbi:MAG TPA: DUF1203 domain-containing protein [Gemmatimonadota bacterium]|nr:DUF1203 domain-containing protein [Gemmatimonadota bacterium]